MKDILSYSQCGQDIFVYSLLKNNNGTFLDLGCNLPIKINNTYLLELKNWQGVSIDIVNYEKEWTIRNTPFVNEDCFKIDFINFLPKYFNDKIIDYLSLDMEVVGERYKLLKNVLDSGYEFKIITIEHDSHINENFEKNEKIPQRKILNEFGYHLLCGDVSQMQHPNSFYEDWWVNPKYFNLLDLKKWISNKESCDKIFNKVDIKYIIAEESKKW
jgi:hypothetical protein